MPSPSAASPDASCRLLIDGPGTGTWNMAVDEILLEAAAERQRASLRFYRWAEPTLSLGYFQPYDDRESHAGSRTCAVVRRSTGGGAILHDQELTYSLTVPMTHRLARSAAGLYDVVHGALVSALLRQSVQAERAAVSSLDLQTREPFLCFLRESLQDVRLAGFKICGSAQRRLRGALLQHGSLLLARSASARELPGICELSGQAICTDSLIAAWSEAVATSLDMRLAPDSLAVEERSLAAQLAADKYASPAWTRRR